MKVKDSTRCLLLPEDHGYFKQCHASTIVKLPGGDLAVAFFGGRREGEGDVAIWLSRCVRGIWQAPQRQFAEEGLAHWNPVLHGVGDTLWLFYKVGATVHEWRTRWAVSHDLGRSWSAPRSLVVGDTLPRGPVRNKLIVTSKGEWMAPASIETDAFWDAFVDISNDQGKTWHKADVPIAHQGSAAPGRGEVWTGLAAEALWESDPGRVFRWDGVIQPSLWESRPGAIHMLLRSTRGHIYRSDSADDGRSWCAAYATALPNNNSGIDLARLDDGRLVLAYNPIAGNWGRRYPISLSCSSDNGQSWSEPFDLESDQGEFSYPAIISDGARLHLTYTLNRKNIVYRQIAL